MASLWKHPESKFWVACFTDKAGKRRKLSTKETSRKKAQKIADEYEAAARRKRTALQTRRVISGLHKELTGEEFVFPTVRAYFTEWLETKRPECEESTYDFYSASVTKFLNWLGPKADEEISEVTKQQVTDFRNNLAATLAGKTVNHHLKCLRMIFKAARADEKITDDPCEFVKAVAMDDAGKRRRFTIPELKTVLTHCTGEWRSLVLFGLYTGQRLADLVALTWANIDLDAGEIRLVTRKTGRSMTIPLAEPLRDHIATLPACDDPAARVHPNAWKILDKSAKVGTLSNQFGKILADAGLREPVSHRKTAEGRSGKRKSVPLSFHSLRHTAVTLLKEAGIPQAVVMELIGHDSEAVSAQYTKVGSEALTKAAAAFPKL